MTKELIEQERRFTVLEEQGKQNCIDHNEIKILIGHISKKLDDAIESKADKDEVKTISNRMWGFISAVATAFISILIYLVQNSIGVK
jgi:hypothetical protein